MRSNALSQVDLMTLDRTLLRIDLYELLARIDAMASERPIAAGLVRAADAEDTDAKALATVLAGDVALAGRVMKLANSAYYGMRGRVTSLQMAVTVVGFTTVRTMATVALTRLEDESGLPEDFWPISTSLAVAASRLGPSFGERPGEAMCLGVLAQLGSALLYQHDGGDYAELLQTEASFAARRREELRRYGVTSVGLTAMALETWGFPGSLVVPAQRIDDRTSLAGGLLRASYEVVSRLTIPGHRPVPIGPLSRGAVRDQDLPGILHDVHNQAGELRRLLISD